MESEIQNRILKSGIQPLNCLSNSVARMYADDTHLNFASNNIETINDVINHDLSNVNTWLTGNKLTLNSSKTEFMLIGSRQSLGTYDTSPKLIIGGDIIKQVSSVKSLGCLLYTSPSPRDLSTSRMPSSA